MIYVSIIDYGSGNIRSVYNSVKATCESISSKTSICVTSDKKKIEDSSHLILPGVGSFKGCLSGVREKGDLFESLEKNVIVNKKPFLGICVGMQMLFSEGYEGGRTRGFNWIPGKVTKIKPKSHEYKIPHIGWNGLKLEKVHPVIGSLLENKSKSEIETNAYFVHSYECKPENSDHLVLTTYYGEAISAMVAKENIIGTQFHPEKSHLFGLEFLKSFLTWET